MRQFAEQTVLAKNFPNLHSSIVSSVRVPAAVRASLTAGFRAIAAIGAIVVAEHAGAGWIGVARINLRREGCKRLLESWVDVVIAHGAIPDQLSGRRSVKSPGSIVSSS